MIPVSMVPGVGKITLQRIILRHALGKYDIEDEEYWSILFGLQFQVSQVKTLSHGHLIVEKGFNS